MVSIEHKLQEVKQRIDRAVREAGRPAASVTLLAVSKTFGADAVQQAHAAGQRHFGENYVQEALDKIHTLAALRGELAWHFIGPLQSNKTRSVAEAFDWVHAVDRVKIAQRLAEQRPAGLPPLNLCLQVNISGESSKSGVLPAELPALARAVAALPADRVRLRGLMAIPEPASDFAAQRVPHRALRELMVALNASGLALDTLSMGMSADLEAAIAEGATVVRVGSAIFGTRGAVARGGTSSRRRGFLRRHNCHQRLRRCSFANTRASPNRRGGSSVSCGCRQARG
jgi:PLP dependent protein